MKARVIGGMIAALVLLLPAAYFSFAVYPGWEAASRFMRTGLFQIRAGVEQFLAEHPERIFVHYQDVIGSAGYVREPMQAYGEDFRQVFPRRCDESEFVLTYPDGKRIVLLNGQLQAADGTFPRYSKRAGQINQPERIARYQQEQAAARQPDGPFRAYYADGILWGEASCRQGVVVGPHRIFARYGKVILSTEFPGAKP